MDDCKQVDEGRIGSYASEFKPPRAVVPTYMSQL